MNTLPSKEKTDSDIKSDVLIELKYEPSVKTTDIGVLVKDGAVTLTGFTTTYGEKWDAVRATKRVSGVRAVADDIKVKLASSHDRTDGEIAASAADHLEPLLGKFGLTRKKRRLNESPGPHLVSIRWITKSR